MKKLFFPILLIILIACTPYQANASWEAPSKVPLFTKAEVKLKSDLQRLWIEHAWWTRSFIVSGVGGLEDEKQVTNRFLQNQEDIGNLMKPYYGEEAGNKLTDLLKEHVLIAGEIIKAAKVKDKAKVDELNKEWYRNADDIIVLLTTANRNWSKKEMTDMFYAHLKITTKAVEDRFKKDYESEIKTADVNKEHLIHMGNFLAEGIIKQFPKKFK